jgi:hypothetical protein
MEKPKAETKQASCDANKRLGKQEKEQNCTTAIMCLC